MKLKLSFLLFLFSFLSFAQKTTVTGVVTDKDLKGETLPFANVTIKGKSLGTTTDMQGKYSLEVPAGNHTLVFSFLGYETKEIKFSIAAGETKTINEMLGSGSVTMEDVVVKATVGREKETALLLEQKKAIEMKQAIGAQELSRKGISDAAAAVVKTTGITKQEGVNNVFVRGLGDRYNSTTLNGLPLPSEDPVYKNISLDFFGSNIIKNININKTFNASLYGDNAGANIDISSKELDKGSFFSASAGTGFNTNALSTKRFQVADGTYSYFGFLQNGKTTPITDLTKYDFNSNIKTQSVANPINTNFSIAGGRKINIGNNALSLFGVATSNSDFSYKNGFYGQSGASGNYTRSDDMQKSEYKATQTLLGNAKYKYNKGTVAINSLFIHNNNQYVNRLLGFDDDINGNDTPDAQKSLLIRQQNNDNNLFSNQLLADYKFSDKITANVGAVYSTLCGSEPDRKTNTYAFNDNTGKYNLATDSAGQNNRYFSTLDENDLGGKAEINYTFNPESNNSSVLTIGVNGRTTDRDFYFIEFDFKNNGPTIDPENPDLVLNQQNLDAGVFELQTLRGTSSIFNPLKPFYYLAKRNIGAGYAQLVHPFNEKLIAQVGLRFEGVKQTINWDTNLSSSVNDLTVDPSIINKSFILPSFNLKYSPNEKHALRFAASETYTMPQFKEMAPFLYADVNSTEYGNPYLIPSTDYNVDLKFDWYVSKKEIVSFGAFYKYIKDPISRIQIASSANDYSYVNTSKAFVSGLELEVRKAIYSFESKTGNKDLTFGLNASYLYSEQAQNDTDKDKLTTIFTHDKGKMQGASPLLINADLSYNVTNDETSLLSTLVFNYFHDKVYTVGTLNRENVIEKAVPTLDFINRFEMKKLKLTLNFGAKNILNPKFRLTQQTTDFSTNTTHENLVSSYRKGITAVFGLSWQL